jgi:hypothetical protein
VVLLGPSWLPAAILLGGLALAVSQNVWMRPLGLVDTRWVVASLTGVCFLALLTPNAWFAAFLLVSALSVPVSIAALRTYRLKEVGAPTYGVIALLQLGVWLVAISLLTQSIRGWVEPFLALLIAAAVYVNVHGFLQVYFGIGVARRIAYGPSLEILNEPQGCLHTVWRPACLNAMLLPVTLALALHRSPAVSACSLAAALTMCWHLYVTKTTTALLGMIAGVGALLFALHVHPLVFTVAFPLALVAYPSLRGGIVKDARWEIWALLWSRVKADRFIGRGMGAWAGAEVRGTVESERVWLWAHSEWLEALYDCGPLPVLIALGFLADATWTVWQGVSTMQAGVFGSLIALAVVSAGYMPFRTWPLNVVGIGVLAAWLA